MKEKPIVIAEIGCNHKGDMRIAEELILVAAAWCKVDAVKFQKRNNRELLTPEQYAAPHPNPAHAYGESYGEHREFLEFDLNQHRRLKEYAESVGVAYSSSAWDLTSAKEIASLEPAFIKVPSACNNDQQMISWLCDEYGGEIHVSSGMTKQDELNEMVDLFVKRGRVHDLVLYHCVSGYPVAFEDCSLMEIPRLKDRYGSLVKRIGFSGHHLGIAIDIAAYALGAEVIERHFTLDRTWKGTDHAASLEPDGMRRLVRDLNAARAALAPKATELLPVEEVQRSKLKRRFDSRKTECVA